MIDFPVTQLEFQIHFKKPINIYDILFPAFIEMRMKFEYVTTREFLSRCDWFLSTIFRENIDEYTYKVIDDIEKRKENYNLKVSKNDKNFLSLHYGFYYGDEPWKFPLYKESKEREENDNNLCQYIVLCTIDMCSLKKYINKENVEKYEDILNFMEINQNDILEIKNYEKYDEFMTNCMKLNEEDNIILQKILSSHILQDHIGKYEFILKNGKDCFYN